MKTEWTPSDTSKSIHFTDREPILEFQDNAGEWHDFHLVTLEDRVVFGGVCNCGFLESGYIARDSSETLDETLQDLLADLAVYYNDGGHFVSRIIYNDRM